MSVTQLQGLLDMVGKRGTWRAKGGLRIPVVVRDARPGMFGRTDVLIEPIDGDGQQWVDLKNVDVEE